MKVSDSQGGRVHKAGDAAVGKGQKVKAREESQRASECKGDIQMFSSLSILTHHM